MEKFAFDSCIFFLWEAVSCCHGNFASRFHDKFSIPEEYALSWKNSPLILAFFFYGKQFLAIMEILNQDFMINFPYRKNMLCHGKIRL
jgi:hypothetical protein